MQIRVIDRTTKSERFYRREVWFPYYRVLVSSYGASHKHRFIKSLTAGEYMFPIVPVDVPDHDFFKRYHVSDDVRTWGVRR